MAKSFKTKGEVHVVKGYLSTDAKKITPVNHKGFVTAQKRAHLLITVASKMAGKTFVAKEADDIKALISDVKASLSSTEAIDFVPKVAATKGSTTVKLEKEALSFIKDSAKSEEANKVNAKLQEFSIVKEFEEIGLFFDSKTVKLSNIYSLEEIVEAGKIVYSVVDSI